jgi:hypothetical protein
MLQGMIARGFGLVEASDFHHLGSAEIDAENQTLINHKCVCGALNRQFLVGAVSGWFSHLFESVSYILIFQHLQVSNSKLSM